MTDQDVENALRVVFRAKAPTTADGLARIRQPFKDADDLFDMHGNDREIEVLCGAGLAVLLERSDDQAASGALAITTATLNGNTYGRTANELAGPRRDCDRENC